MPTATSVRWRGREVESPLLRRLAVAFVLFVGAVSLSAAAIVAVLGTVLTLTLAVLSLPLHLVLRLLGRRGFFTVRGGQVKFALELAGFRKDP